MSIASKKTKRIVEGSAKIALLACALLSIASVAVITFFIFERGLPLFSKVRIVDFLFGTTWMPTADNPQYGILPFILGSLIVTFLSLLFAVPIGLASGIYLAELSRTRTANLVRRSIEILAGIPSVVYGLFGIAIVCSISRALFGGTGFSILSASIVLGIMTLPTIISITETALRAVPAEYKEGSLAIGATHWQTIAHVLVPAARSGILAGIVLGLGRAIGETMAVLMVGGNAPIMPESITGGFRSLTMNIITDMSYATGDHLTSLFSTAMVLFVFIIGINIALQILLSRSVRVSQGGGNV